MKVSDGPIESGGSRRLRRRLLSAVPEAQRLRVNGS